MTIKSVQIAVTGAVILCYAVSPITSQRQLRAIGEFDMSQDDAALLCAKIDQEKSGVTTGDPNTGVYTPPDFCFFFQWIYCPNVPEDMEKPCGWWEQKPCNYTKFEQEPHFALEEANPIKSQGMEVEATPEPGPPPPPGNAAGRSSGLKSNSHTRATRRYSSTIISPNYATRTKLTEILMIPVMMTSTGWNCKGQINMMHQSHQRTPPPTRKPLKKTLRKKRDNKKNYYQI
ncbi:unnamed protein product [Allacma fusca]|uniref:Uncharacterized protein n=1 Tax=Allacma fusca TaxID=39272 RepID=A0A8J2NNR4_9HEXA|nr:unnamed protein product [Allacma fusca]